MKYIIITTINNITNAVDRFSEILSDWQIVLVGDKKTPSIQNRSNITFLSVANQQDYNISEHLPYNHYVRKNIGYLYALQQGAEIIYDTDDDNLPYVDWGFPAFQDYKGTLVSGTKYYNAYNDYTNELIWPRGYPLRHISKVSKESKTNAISTIGVWQGLADLDPDVDAIHRLIFNARITFQKNDPLVLSQGTYCPFNSQNTLWLKEMLPYAYLPSTVTFRFTDILRGYIAQRCLWAHNKLLGFTKASVYQERNDHDLMVDFKSEIPCYLDIEKLVEILDGLSLTTDYSSNLLKIYQSLVKEGIVSETEIPILKGWLLDIKNLM